MMKTRGTYYVPTMMAAQGLREVLEKGYLPPQVAAKARAAMAALDVTVRRRSRNRSKSRWVRMRRSILTDGFRKSSRKWYGSA
ncbi:MAG: hypothetical protein ABSF22_17235 [Bryobacteraceae bacterium]|jgi:hypothetical protein